MADLEPDSLRAERDALAVLVYSFDFELLPKPRPPEGFTVPDRRCQVEACDATAGQYLSCQGLTDTAPRWIYVGSDGRAGVVASSFAELVSLIIALPYFHDVLKYSARGDLLQMRRAAELLERNSIADLPDLPAAREFLLDSLRLPKPADPVAALHESTVASNATVPIVSDDGWQFDSLIGALSIADHPDSR